MKKLLILSVSILALGTISTRLLAAPPCTNYDHRDPFTCTISANNLAYFKTGKDFLECKVTATTGEANYSDCHYAGPYQAILGDPIPVDKRQYMICLYDLDPPGSSITINCENKKT